MSSFSVSIQTYHKATINFFALISIKMSGPKPVGSKPPFTLRSGDYGHLTDHLLERNDLLFFYSIIRTLGNNIFFLGVTVRVFSRNSPTTEGVRGRGGITAASWESATSPFCQPCRPHMNLVTGWPGLGGRGGRRTSGLLQSVVLFCPLALTPSPMALPKAVSLEKRSIDELKIFSPTIIRNEKSPVSVAYNLSTG